MVSFISSKELKYNLRMTPYEKRVKELEEERLTISDAQAIADMEFESMGVLDYYIVSTTFNS